MTVCRNLRPSLNNQLKGELQSYTDHIISALVDKLGDNLQKLRTHAEDSILSMCEHPSFGVQPCLSVIVRPAVSFGSAKDNKDAKKNMASNKHIIGKYSILMKMLQNYEFNQD